MTLFAKSKAMFTRYNFLKVHVTISFFPKLFCCNIILLLVLGIVYTIACYYL